MWGTRRPVFSDDVVGLFVGCGDSGTMVHGVGAHKDEVRGWMSLLGGQDDVTQNFIFVLGDDVMFAFDDFHGDLHSRK